MAVSKLFGYYDDFIDSIVIKTNNGDFGLILIIAGSGSPCVKVIYRDNKNNITSVFLSLFKYEYKYNSYKRFFDKNVKASVIEYIESNKDEILDLIKRKYEHYSIVFKLDWDFTFV